MDTSSIDKVLIVDDDANIRLIAEMSLEGLTAWKLTLAACGEEALAYLAKETPELILLDMMMPDMDGITLFGKIKTQFGDKMPSVIFMTAKVQSHEVEKYRTLGACGVIMKPFDPMTLPKQIVEMLEASKTQ